MSKSFFFLLLIFVSWMFAFGNGHFILMSPTVGNRNLDSGNSNECLDSSPTSPPYVVNPGLLMRKIDMSNVHVHQICSEKNWYDEKGDTITLKVNITIAHGGGPLTAILDASDGYGLLLGNATAPAINGYIMQFPATIPATYKGKYNSHSSSYYYFFKGPGDHYIEVVFYGGGTPYTQCLDINIPGPPTSSTSSSSSSSSSSGNHGTTTGNANLLFPNASLLLALCAIFLIILSKL